MQIKKYYEALPPTDLISKVVDFFKKSKSMRLVYNSIYKKNIIKHNFQNNLKYWKVKLKECLKRGWTNIM